MTAQADTLRQLLAQDASGPWAVDPAEPCLIGGDLQGSEGEWGQRVAETDDPEVAALIVGMRNRLPALLDRLDKLEAAVDLAYHRPVPDTDRWFCQVCRKIGGHRDDCPGATLAEQGEGNDG
jgi:hypothetical protein